MPINQCFILIIYVADCIAVLQMWQQIPRVVLLPAKREYYQPAIFAHNEFFREYAT